MLDALRWTAIYDDGTSLHEDDADGWGDIDLTRLRQFIVAGPAGLPCHAVALSGHMRPVFFRRKRTLLDPQTGDAGEHRLIAVCVGWQDTVGGRNVRALSWLLPDGSVAHTSVDLDELEA